MTFSPPPPSQIGRRACTGFGSQPRVAELEELAVEVGDVFGEERADALDLPLELAQPDRRGRERDAVRVVLALVPAGAEPERDAAAAEAGRGWRSTFASTAGCR